MVNKKTAEPIVESAAEALATMKVKATIKEAQSKKLSKADQKKRNSEIASRKAQIQGAVGFFLQGDQAMRLAVNDFGAGFKALLEMMPDNPVLQDIQSDMPTHEQIVEAYSILMKTGAYCKILSDRISEGKV